MYTVKTTNEELEIFTFDTQEEAVACASGKAQYGYQVFAEDGKMVFAPYSDLVCRMLAEGKRITDHVRTSGFTYGHALLNPAMNEVNKKVSCDRFVGWALYNVGYTDQPEQSGLYVFCGNDPTHDLTTYCENHGFTRIDKLEDVQAGDVMFVIPSKTSTGRIYPGHTFMYAGKADGDNAYRYDCGSDKRIQSVQPMCEPVNDFMYAYRPKA